MGVGRGGHLLSNPKALQLVCLISIRLEMLRMRADEFINAGAGRKKRMRFH